MAEPAVNIPRMSAKEYGELERQSPVRHEFVDGVVYAMTGTTKRHDLISTDALGILLNTLQPPCIVFSANVKVHVEAQDSEAYFYPDVHVVCSDLDTDPLASAMPVVVIEVASPSTASYDRGAKFARYKTLASLQEYVILQQDSIAVEVFRRRAEWNAEPHGPSDTITLESLQLTVPVAQFYRRVRF